MSLFSTITKSPTLEGPKEVHEHHSNCKALHTVSLLTQKRKNNLIMSSFYICFLNLMILLVIISCSLGIHSGPQNKFLHSFNGENNQSARIEESQKTGSNTRKLLVHGSCTSRDISISQSRDSSTSGIPQYIVQIVNTCVCGCAPSNIHLHCGWFASARMVNRMTFKRLSYDDCLVNEGKPLKTSQIISFTYSNSFMYPLSFKYAKFC